MWSIAIVLLCCCLSPLIDLGLRKMIQYNRTETTIEELLSDTINADVIVLGNSRALCSYNPLTLNHQLQKKVFNIGVSGQPFGISYLRYQLYLRHNKIPQLLIINIDNNELEMYSSDFGRERYYPYFSDEYIRNYLYHLGFSMADLYMPLVKYRGDYKLVGYSLLSLFNIYPLPYIRHTYGYYNGNKQFDGSELRKVLAQNDSIYGSVEKEAVELLCKLIQEQLAEDVNIVFVYAPQYRILQEHLQMENIKQIYDSIATTYNISTLDYSNIEWSGDSTYFYNANHVNQRGAELFSTRIAHNLDSLFFSSNNQQCK